MAEAQILLGTKMNKHCDEDRARGIDGTACAASVFRAVPTDNGTESADEESLAALIGKALGETRPFYCRTRCSDRRGSREHDRVEFGKLPPKGRGSGSTGWRKPTSCL